MTTSVPLGERASPFVLLAPQILDRPPCRRLVAQQRVSGEDLTCFPMQLHAPKPAGPEAAYDGESIGDLIPRDGEQSHQPVPGILHKDLEVEGRARRDDLELVLLGTGD